MVADSVVKKLSLGSEDWLGLDSFVSQVPWYKNLKTDSVIFLRYSMLSVFNNLFWAALVHL